MWAFLSKFLTPMSSSHLINKSKTSIARKNSTSLIFAVEKELNFDKAKTCAKSGAYFVYVSIFKQVFNTVKIVIIFQHYK